MTIIKTLPTMIVNGGLGDGTCLAHKNEIRPREGKRSGLIPSRFTAKLSPKKYFPNGGNGDKKIKTNNSYICGMINGKEVPLHNFLLKPPKGLSVDHINRDTFDNRRKNLRWANRSDQGLNRRCTSKTSNIRGVSKDTYGGWSVQYKNKAKGIKKETHRKIKKDAIALRKQWETQYGI